MIIVSAELAFNDKDARDQAVEATIDIQMATRQDEAGCLAYCFAADPGEPTRIQVYEVWEDGPSLAAHFEHPNYEAMLVALGGSGLLSSTNRAYLATREEPVYGPNGTRKTAFFED